MHQIQNNARGPANNNNDFNNLFGNIMNQLMTPDNLNSIAGAWTPCLSKDKTKADLEETPRVWEEFLEIFFPI